MSCQSLGPSSSSWSEQGATWDVASLASVRGTVTHPVPCTGCELLRLLLCCPARRTDCPWSELCAPPSLPSCRLCWLPRGSCPSRNQDHTPQPDLAGSVVVVLPVSGQRGAPPGRACQRRILLGSPSPCSSTGQAQTGELPCSVVLQDPFDSCFPCYNPLSFSCCVLAPADGNPGILQAADQPAFLSSPNWLASRRTPSPGLLG